MRQGCLTEQTSGASEGRVEELFGQFLSCPKPTCGQLLVSPQKLGSVFGNGAKWLTSFVSGCELGKSFLHVETSGGRAKQQQHTKLGVLFAACSVLFPLATPWVLSHGANSNNQAPSFWNFYRFQQFFCIQLSFRLHRSGKWFWGTLLYSLPICHSLSDAAWVFHKIIRSRRLLLKGTDWFAAALHSLSR